MVKIRVSQTQIRGEENPAQDNAATRNKEDATASKPACKAVGEDAVNAAPRATIARMDLSMSLREREERRLAFRALPFILFHILLYTAVIFTHYDMATIQDVQGGVRGAMLRKASPSYAGGKFEDITQAQNFWDWVKEVGIPFFWDIPGKRRRLRGYAAPSPGGAGGGGAEASKAGMGTMQKGRMTSQKKVKSFQLYNKVVGGIIIKQQRVEAVACDVHYNSPDLYTHTETMYQDDCHPDSEVIEPCWATTPTTCNKNTTVYGLKSVYGPELIYLDLNDTFVDVVSIMRQAHTDEWLSKFTSSISMSITMYNGEKGVYSVVDLTLEMGRGGGIEAGGKVLSSQIPPTWNGELMILDITYAAVIAIIIVSETMDIIDGIRSPGCSELVEYMQDGWNLLDWTVVIISIIQATNFKIMESDLVKAFSILHGDGDVAISREDILEFSILMGEAVTASFSVRTWGAIVIFLLVLRLFKTLSLHPRLAFLTRTLSESLGSLIPFMFVFSTVYACFVCSGQLLFGAEVETFSTVSNSVLTLFNMLLGEFDYDELSSADETNAVLFLVSFYVLVYYLLLNFFLAIVLDAYGAVKLQSSNESPIAEDMYSFYLHQRRRCRRHNRGMRNYEEMADFIDTLEEEKFTAADVARLLCMDKEETDLIYNGTVEDVEELLTDEGEKGTQRGDMEILTDILLRIEQRQNDFDRRLLHLRSKQGDTSTGLEPQPEQEPEQAKDLLGPLPSLRAPPASRQPASC